MESSHIWTPIGTEDSLVVLRVEQVDELHTRVWTAPLENVTYAPDERPNTYDTWLPGTWDDDPSDLATATWLLHTDDIENHRVGDFG